MRTNVVALFTISIVLRVLFLVFGTRIDGSDGVQYTDIDYHVFSDAARYITEGKSPFERTTYRYTPFLALMLVPNIKQGYWFGKALFATTDILCGAALQISTHSVIATSIWLLNPFVFIVSTRGNADSLVVLCSLLALTSACSYRDNHGRASFYGSAIALGVAVHLKMYPVIYAPLLYLSVGPHRPTLHHLLRRPLPNRDQVAYTLLSGGTCLALHAAALVWCGRPYWEESVAYHFIRSDHRHNLSPWFLPLYHAYSTGPSLLSTLAFLPQAALLVGITLRYRSLPSVGAFLLTLAFVAFNKVSTAQYFVWWIAFVPYVYLHLKNFAATLLAFGLWALVFVRWLQVATRLEFHSEPVLAEVWAHSLALFVCYGLIAAAVIWSVRTRAEAGVGNGVP
ncbi:Mannosyltransferase, DXD [Carpediemonas membranifera]|uniref:GPI mannosyltransferase 1 n=1 Tax=Carpediemonas membranifera TaxID=201153 RepID=A0A8J6ASS4_9EUKA|nr:Mannosyltransferase, DXD [Carpediemonas membranifera]|eukprot:KAG9391460.1 Mannosyltransferase, DXD [Carpediemonas membranifera]